MSIRNSVCAQYGTIRIEHLSAEEESLDVAQKLRPFASHISMYRWHSSDLIAEQVPDDLTFNLMCVTGSDSVRRFCLLDMGYEQFIRKAFSGGLGMLCQLRNLDAHHRSSYRQMYWLFIKMRGLKEHQTRQFRYYRDLTLINAASPSNEKYGLLPDDIGFALDGTGERWSIKTLLARGRLLAHEYGLEQPTISQNIAYGFFAAAKNNPMRIENHAEIEGLVRTALYDGGLPLDISVDQRDWIIERVLSAIYRHLDVTQEEFDRWFTGPNNTFIRDIARKRCPHGKVTQDMVRQVLLDLGWSSYDYVSNCIHTHMRSFRNSMAEPLNLEEREVFEQVYLKQDYFANLPLVLLVERLPLLQIPLVRIMEGDDFDLIGVLHRLLTYYVSMIHRRREVDRDNQQAIRNPERNLVQAHTGQLDKAPSNDGGARNLLGGVASEHREIRNAHCSCETTDSWHEKDIDSSASQQQIEWIDYCVDCGHSEPVSISAFKFQELLERDIQS